MPHTLDPKRLDEVFDEINANTHKLNNWEMNEFLPSVYDQYLNNGTLTERQLEILEKIYMKV